MAPSWAIPSTSIKPITTIQGKDKFKTNHYVLDSLVCQGYIDFLAVGVDDANKEGVQINEIRFVENYIDRYLGGCEGQNRIVPLYCLMQMAWVILW